MKPRSTQDKRIAGEAEVLEAIKAMPDDDRAIGEKLHEIIMQNGPQLVPRTWYGMPSYGNENGKVILFFRSKKKFGERFMTLGFNDSAKLDDGAMWPIYYAIKELTPEVETELARIVKKSVG